MTTLREERLNAIRLILLDHRDCLLRDGFPLSDYSVYEKWVSELGLKHPQIMTRDEYESKANLVFQIDELIKWIEEGAND